MLKTGIQEYKDDGKAAGYQLTWEVAGFDIKRFMQVIGDEFLRRGDMGSANMPGWESFSYFVKEEEVYLVVQIDDGSDRKRRSVARRLFAQFPAGTNLIGELKALLAAFIEKKVPERDEVYASPTQGAPIVAKRRQGKRQLKCAEFERAREVLLSLSCSIAEGSNLVVALTNYDSPEWHWPEVSLSTLSGWVHDATYEEEIDFADEISEASRCKSQVEVVQRYESVSKYRVVLNRHIARYREGKGALPSSLEHWVELNRALLGMEHDGWIDVLERYGCMWLHFQWLDPGSSRQLQSLLEVAGIGNDIADDLDLLARFFAFCRGRTEFEPKDQQRLRNFVEVVFGFVLSLAADRAE